MDEAEIRRSVAEILETEPGTLTEEKELDSFSAYDSTARLSLMVCLSDLSGCPFSLSALQDLRTYGDILRLMSKSSSDANRS
jgi:acyl carrier protein